MDLKHAKDYLERCREKDYFDTYAVMIGYHGESVLLTSPNADQDTYFDMASVGKVLVTSPLILQCVSKGMLRLEDTLDRFFPDVSPEKHSVTIQHLLTHTSGIISFTFPPDIAAAGSDALAELILKQPLAFKPGSDFCYSCVGMILLGFILERLYGMPLDQIFEEQIKKPLGLTRSCFNLPLGAENAALCYKDFPGRKNRADDGNVYVMRNCVAGSGGSFASIGDVHRMVEAILTMDERLYSKELFVLAEQDYTPHYSQGRGLGYWLADKRYPESPVLFPDGAFGHVGSTGQAFFIDRQRELYVITMTNMRRCHGDHALPIDYETYMEQFMKMRGELDNEIYWDLQL